MTAITNRNVVIAASVIAAIFIGQGVSTTVAAQETEAVDTAKIEADIAGYTASVSAGLSDRLAQPSIDIQDKLAELEERSTIKPDYASTRRYAVEDTEPVVVVADAR